jgi:hypothetical protein
VEWRAYRRCAYIRQGPPPTHPRGRFRRSMRGRRIGVRREREDKEMRLIFCNVRDLLSHVNYLNFKSNIAFLAAL